MIDIIFNVQSHIGSSQNYLIDLHKDYAFDNSNFCFGKLSKTNIFIGENNAGKSRFLRHLFNLNFYALEMGKVDNIFSSLNKKDLYDCYDTIPECKFEKFNDIYTRVDKRRSPYTNIADCFFRSLNQNSSQTSIKNKFYFPIIRGSKDYKTIINNKLKKFLEGVHIQNKDSINHFISLLNLQNNGLESFDIYNDIIYSEYFDNTEVKNQILTGGQLYQEIKLMLLGQECQRKIIEGFQIFLKKNFFTEYDTVQLIPNEKEKVLYIKIGNDERPIYNWGDGTQQLIIILYSLYKHKDEQNKMFFIEEPEIYLHPGILRQFMEVINSEIFKNHQYFITTHSNIILDTSADTNVNMSIFKFKKVKDREKNDGKTFLIEQCNNGDVSLLNELGVRNSSVFLSNCSIWVEGITDRLYLKHYLSLYNKKYSQKYNYRENIDFTFIEYGGANIVHFNFDEKSSQDSINAKYISNNIFLIADNDNTKEGEAKNNRKQHLKEVLKENFYELQATEIENLISKDTLKSVLIKDNPKQEDAINKVFNNELNYEHEYLGKFVDSLFADIDVRKYSASSGTIKNKLEFCKYVISIVDDYDKLSDEAKVLTEKIYLFIEKHNKI